MAAGTIITSNGSHAYETNIVRPVCVNILIRFPLYLDIAGAVEPCSILCLAVSRDGASNLAPFFVGSAMFRFWFDRTDRRSMETCPILSMQLPQKRVAFTSDENCLPLRSASTQKFASYPVHSFPTPHARATDDFAASASRFPTGSRAMRSQSQCG